MNQNLPLLQVLVLFSTPSQLTYPYGLENVFMKKNFFLDPFNSNIVQFLDIIKKQFYFFKYDYYQIQ